MIARFTRWASAAALALSITPLGQAAETLPDPDGKPADMSKPVQVYILLGQSNMLGFGTVKGEKDGTLEHAVKSKKLYPYLIDDAGNWTERKDVRNVRVMGSGLGGSRQFNNEWMTIKGGRIGPEIGIGHHVGEATDAPVLILKSCIGNRALGWDLLPPGGEGFEFTDSKGVTWVHPGYKGTPERWKKGEEPKKIKWYAGMQYDGDIARAKKVLSELDKFYPDAKSYEVAGFFWWQGDRDSRSEALSSRYEKTSCTSSRPFARISTRPTQSSSAPRLAKQKKAPLTVAAKSSTPCSRWTAIPASTRNSRATSPPCTRTRFPRAAAPAAITAATPKLT